MTGTPEPTLDRRPLLIVNADDLGRTPGINRGIFEAHRKGIVTSATMMVGFPAAREAAAALADHPDLGVGLHVTLSGALPTLPLERVGRLLDQEGRLPRRPERAEGRLAARMPGPHREAAARRPDEGPDGAVTGGAGTEAPAASGAEVHPMPGSGPALDRREQTDEWHEVRATLAEVLDEVRHQLELFEELTGRPPTHLDTHHHSHRILPLVLEALVEVARDRRLPVRNASPAVARRLHREGIPTTERFVEDFYGETTDVDDLLGLLHRSRGDSTEVMCHPALVDTELQEASTYTAERERELATLTDPAVRREVDEGGWRLGHFGDLALDAAAGANGQGASGPPGSEPEHAGAAGASPSGSSEHGAGRGEGRDGAAAPAERSTGGAGPAEARSRKAGTATGRER